RSVAFRERTQVDVDDVVFEAATIGKPCKVSIQHTQPIAVPNLSGGRDVRVEPKKISWFGTGEIERRHAGQENGDQILAVALARPVQNGIETVLEPGHLRAQISIEKLLIVLGIAAVPFVLLAERNHDLVDERQPQSRNLDEGTIVVSVSI